MKIISGGQTGVDRAALDVALKYQIDCGGWCPEGRLDEFGRIPEHYPIKELPGADYSRRTLQNVIDSDATVIFYYGKLRGGTEHTVQCCVDQKQLHISIDAAVMSPNDAARAIVSLVREHTIETLNIAGQRQTDWPGGYDYAFAAPDMFAQSY